MSAWIVAKEHVDVLVAAGLHGPSGRTVSPDTAWNRLRWFDEEPDPTAPMSWYNEHRREITRETADEVGRMLWLENVASVAHRYPDDGPTDRPGYAPGEERGGDVDLAAALYTYTDPRYRPSAGEILCALGCFEYQSCEHPGWRSSEAHRYCDALTHAVCGTLYAGPWGWDADELEKALGLAVAS